MVFASVSIELDNLPSDPCLKSRNGKNNNSKKKSGSKPKENNAKSKDTRKGRPRKNSSGDLSLDTCCTAPLSDSENSPVRKPRSIRKVNKKNVPQQQQQQHEEQLSEEEKRRYVALDCEMVGVGENGFQSALARVVLVDWDGQVVLDEYIRPDREVTDYRTFVSGIRQSDLMASTMDFESVRELVLQHLQGKILVGHALKNDLHALDIRHPWQQIRDTAKYEPFMKVRFDDGVLWPRKLRDLVTEKLSREIQQPGMPHSPYEDALAALDLYKKVRGKWEKVMDYKIKKTAEYETRAKDSSCITM